MKCKYHSPEISSNSFSYTCQYCGKPCTRPGPLKLHEQSCPSNPNRVHIKHDYCNLPSPATRAKQGGWQCPSCPCIFESKNKLYEHRHEKHKDTIKTRIRNNICPYCHESYKGRKRDHYKICTKKPHGPHKWTIEERLRMSAVKQQFAKDHPDKCNWKTSDRFVSPPCETLKSILSSNNFSFVSEYTDSNWAHAYSLDIAFVDIKLDIEVNGNQHYVGGQLKPYYQRRHDYLTTQGWTVIELHFKDCYRQNKIAELLTMLREKLPSNS